MPSQVYRFADGNVVTTDIDRRHCSREVPMRVLSLGLCRTGSLSLVKALKTLGYSHTYHANDAIFANPQDCELWLEAVQAKFEGKGEPWGRKEFDQLLGHCQAVTDIPAILFAEELIHAYPEAKVILTVRDVDDWHRSVKNTIDALITSPAFHVFNIVDYILRSRTRFVRPVFAKVWNQLFEGDFEQNGRRVFHEHYKRIESLVPPERLLIYHVKEGWEPLCGFLNEPVPSVPMPHENEMKTMQQKFQKALVYNARDYLSSIFSILSSASFAFLTLSALCGENLTAPKVLDAMKNAPNVFKTGVSFVSASWK
ncbi:hypothetical protein FE257_007951 [Aspergillus nanangensis]|uniref:NAD dependent epimerase/dehydratase n=1 Tax=Aspergillus nanangensis TaxID=2582783 RepID=A0AAD4H085_ASPNN|nr:hypothetical protein FE257_007951 [Aspergillus nanangensis]